MLARVAVPFFLHDDGALSGADAPAFLAADAAALCGCCTAVSAFKLVRGNIFSVGLMRKFLLEGTFYHLWYFPAVLLGVPLVCLLRKLGTIPAFCAAGLLYLIGLGGDSYYGFLVDFPAVHAFCQGCFHAVWLHKKRPVFRPLFLFAGHVLPEVESKTGAVGFVVSLTAMRREALWLHGLGYSATTVCIFSCRCACFFVRNTACVEQGAKSADTHVLHVGLHHPSLVHCCGARAAKLCGVQVPSDRKQLGSFQRGCASQLAGAVCMMRLKPRSIPCGARAWRRLTGKRLCTTFARWKSRRECGDGGGKADGYGHGAVLVARTLQKAGVTGWAVACLSEGIALRRAGIRGPHSDFGLYRPAQAPLLARWRLTQTVVDRSACGGAFGHRMAGARTSGFGYGHAPAGVPAQDLPAVRRIFHAGTPHRGVFCISAPQTERQRPSKCIRNSRRICFGKRFSSFAEKGIDPGEVHLQALRHFESAGNFLLLGACAGIALYRVYSGTFAGKNPVRLCGFNTARPRSDGSLSAAR